ncbi:MAG: MaoC family dehydratase N-terminal domain-containing protein [Gammaproteobacteria bacterium]|nr:MaoC family dehydratase N-terminal domain-containing protein [Gammaproteobacteria bacterium]MCP5199891.1 MaoC family dehydratase N-terminal domain-containing protein [Gammaproteobacteria bacterium]
MSDLITDDIRAWIGRADPPLEFEVTRRDIVKYAIATEQRQAKYLAGDEAPPMFLFGADRPLVGLDELGPDGLRRDTLTPELPLKRVMAGGIRQRYHRPIRAGDRLVIEKSITDIYEKQGSSGPLIFVVYEITVKTADGELVMQETQTRINR